MIRLLFSGTNWNSLRHKTEYNFNKVINWLNIKKLTLNLNKTMFMIFSINIILPLLEEIIIYNCLNVSKCNCLLV